MDEKTVFFLGFLLTASGVVSPPLALLGGIVFAFFFAHPFAKESSCLSRLLLQVAVVCLGFGMNIHEVMRAGRSGFLYTAVSIVSSLSVGLLIGRIAAVTGKASLLISAGTAICGGSAIAAVAPVVDANEEEISVSMGTVFILNSLALFLFPAIGAALHLTQGQFGLWSALAIHDTSSVVGATAKYGAQALSVGTTVKLARALWIIPVTLVAAAYSARLCPRAEGQPRAKIKLPWFILFFCMAAALNTWMPHFAPAYGVLSYLGKAGLCVTLFLIGTSLSRTALRKVGMRPLLQGVVLWILVAGISLVLVQRGTIAI
ncbi:MAG: putative sulfate exporter family transporter [Acidobacteria bacterium]|nr:putative sulfate exporter family transporter [Acidobacteriota bacterium]